MTSNLPTGTAAAPAPTSLVAKLLNLLVCPSTVFDEVVVGPPRPEQWLVPTALVCVASLVVLNATSDGERTAAEIGQLLVAGAVNQAFASALNEHWRAIAQLVTCLGAFFGVLWSAFVLWFIGRVLLRTRFRFSKAIEVAALSSTILVLGTVVTGLLALAVGDAAARPGLSLLFLNLAPTSPLRACGEVLNGFSLWSSAVLAIGLSKLSGVGFKEAGFWVAGYWIVLRIALVLLA